MEQLKKNVAPFMRHENSLRSMMLDMCIALSPALIWGFYVFGARSIVITLLSIFFFIGFEILFRFVFKTGLLFQDHSEIVSALIFAMLLPAGTPLWIIPIGALLATGFAKGLLSAFGKCFLNPTLFAKAVLLLIFPKQMNLFTQPFAKLPPFQISLSKETLEPILTQNPLAALKSENFVPPSFSDLITGSLAGNIGEVSALLLLAGFL
ncbi:MAG: RnfABCDGE type electron transport complex subunit D, partial [Clostridia bacterium]|nr:RnfABCDGE type electron transport complex subunit D [Clostridia bacterium]